MSLARNIVIKNEFTKQNADGSGSRGGTPGSYVERYMNRDQACETLTPVRAMDAQSFVERYMARADATDVAISVPELKEDIRGIDGLGGISFSRDEISLSSEKVHAISKRIQEEFEAGKTVFKTVLSFDSEYLVERGIIDPVFEFEERGDFRGNIDQMKLRWGITEGMDRMSRSFDDLLWIGVIQVDTAHVHCHLAMVDTGEEAPTAVGGRVGMLYRKDRDVLRRGIDNALDEERTMRILTSNIAQDRRNVRCFVKRYAHDVIAKREFPQFLLACLPDDEAKWHAGSHAPEMRKPNAMALGFVRDIMHEPGSGYRHALAEINAYARERAIREGLSMEDHRRLVETGVERMERSCVNALYDELRAIPESERNCETPMMDVMAADLKTLAEASKDDPMLEFAFRLRSYSARLDHHRKERDKFHQLYEDYESRENKSKSAQALGNFYHFEELYQAQCMTKYLTFLSFLPGSEELEEELERVRKAHREMEMAALLAADAELARMNADRAEQVGRERYGLSGGRFAKGAASILERREAEAWERYASVVEEVRFYLENKGYVLDVEVDDEGETHIGAHRELMWEFDEVKALDMHHLRYDFARDVPVSENNIDVFVNAAMMRKQYLDGAVDFLKASGQEFLIKELPVTDVDSAVALAEKMRGQDVLESARRDGVSMKHRTHTITLDADYTEVLQDCVVKQLKRMSEVSFADE